ncbi:hypothetical protein FB45DRAFT_1005558 [Roridomyces roridus]|uniref:Uncharacterized protein n=1 Tax=Roridomyces roridus TaxID=1738132 RepID=A0AAD7FK42_9AGAR|nr:hypothetical protein FB45DRAFT_1005558 [Roridomyces roridus]
MPVEECLTLPVEESSPCPTLPVEIIEYIIQKLVLLPVSASEYDQIHRTAALVSHEWSKLFLLHFFAAFAHTRVSSRADVVFFLHRLQHRARFVPRFGRSPGPAPLPQSSQDTLTVTLAPRLSKRSVIDDLESSYGRCLALPMTQVLQGLLCRVKKPSGYDYTVAESFGRLVLEFVDLRCDCHILKCASFLSAAGLGRCIRRLEISTVCNGRHQAFDMFDMFDVNMAVAELVLTGVSEETKNRLRRSFPNARVLASTE